MPYIIVLVTADCFAFNLCLCMSVCMRSITTMRPLCDQQSNDFYCLCAQKNVKGKKYKKNYTQLVAKGNEGNQRKYTCKKLVRKFPVDFLVFLVVCAAGCPRQFGD